MRCAAQPTTAEQGSETLKTKDLSASRSPAGNCATESQGGQLGHQPPPDARKRPKATTPKENTRTPNTPNTKTKQG
jgi:hypothetical protein